MTDLEKKLAAKKTLGGSLDQLIYFHAESACGTIARLNSELKNSAYYLKDEAYDPFRQKIYDFSESIKKATAVGEVRCYVKSALKLYAEIQEAVYDQVQCEAAAADFSKERTEGDVYDAVLSGLEKDEEDPLKIDLVQGFSEAGITTKDSGFVLHTDSGNTFHVTIKKIK